MQLSMNFRTQAVTGGLAQSTNFNRPLKTRSGAETMETLHFVKLCSFVFVLLLFPGYGRAQNTKSEWLAVCAKCLSPTVISKSGIGTSHAVAEAKVTPEGAKEWCENWQPGGDLKSCVREQLTSVDAKKTYRATADCTGGRITAIDGKTYNLAGVWASDVGKGRTKWRDAAGAIVGQDNASGGLSISQQWEVLCPGPVPMQRQNPQRPSLPPPPTAPQTVLSAPSDSGWTLVSADPKVDEQVVGPAGRWIGVAVSPHGVHVAVLALKGSRNVVLFDGVEGPPFDQLVDMSGQTYFPTATGGEVIWPPKFGPIIFSDDGTHCAYFGKIGAQYITVLDGKEIAREPFGFRLPQNFELSFSPHSKHLYYIEYDMAGSRVMMDGKPEPWSAEQRPHVVFSPDGEHYAYVGTQADAAKTRWNVVDGRQVKYFGDNLQFTAAGHLVSVLNENGLDTLVLDNKPVMRAKNISPVWASPVGAQVAAVMLPKPGVPAMLTMNGKPIPGTEGIREVTMYFSPDGKRYAALCKTATYTEFMLIDGKKGQEYQSIPIGSPYNPIFTADSSKFFYVAVNSGKWFAVVNNEESDAFNYLWTPVVGGNAMIAYTTGDGSGRKFDVVVDGKVLPLSRTRGVDTFGFSSDGARYAFVSGVLGSGYNSLVVDGADVPGVSITEVLPSYFLFSPDGKHIAYFGRVIPENGKGGLWIDRKLVFVTDSGGRIHFTPDSQHLLWTDLEVSGMNTLYVDGRPSVKFHMSAFDAVLEAREMGAGGVLTFVTLKDGALVRYRVTPPSDTSVATLLSGAK